MRKPNQFYNFMYNLSNQYAKKPIKQFHNSNEHEKPSSLTKRKTKQTNKAETWRERER